MKTRIISALVALVLLMVALIGFNSIVFEIAISIISVMIVYELLYNTEIVKDKILVTAALLISGSTPLVFLYIGREFLLCIMFIYLAFVMLYFLKVYESVKIQNLLAMFMVSVLVPVDLSIFLMFRERFKYEAIFYVWLALIGAWISDSGAYFAGTLFGKHKLSPKLSPKKTVEGFIGGLVSALLGYLLVAFVMSKTIPLTNPDVKMFEVNYLLLALIAPICSSAGVLGDLFASAIKRQTGIKDYGNIMPGHGGVMDRFDSVLFVTPTLYFILQFVDVAVIFLK